MNEGAFSSFNGVMLGWMRETKRVYDGTLYNVFIGTNVASGDGQNIQVDLRGARGNASTEEEANRLEAEALAQFMADLFVKMADYNRDYNDYGYFRSYAKDSIKVIWNSDYINKIRKVDLPTIFHKEGLVDKFEQDILPAKYFGRAVAADDKGSGKAIGSDGTYDNTKGVILRSKVEKDVSGGSGNASAVPDVSGVAVASKHVFPGDLIPNGVTVKSGGDFEEDEVYVEDADVVCKIVTKLPPFMSAFEVGTTFFNPRSLTENHYLTFGHNSLVHLKNYPFITVKSKPAA
ncbi:MAG: hypothetical protein J5617_02640 [Bacilli bacterium]|nr:hypothetical protein [Bacilli bacterium]